MRMWFTRIWGAVLLGTLLMANLMVSPAIAEIEQSGRSGQPLAVFCNVAPELSTQRSDSVDNWVRICSLWLNFSCKAKKSGSKKINYEADKAGRSEPLKPGFRLIGHQELSQ